MRIGFFWSPKRPSLLEPMTSNFGVIDQVLFEEEQVPFGTIGVGSE